MVDEVDDDGDGTMGDDNDDDGDGATGDGATGYDDDDDNGDCAMGSGATGYDDGVYGVLCVVWAKHQKWEQILFD